MPAAPLIPQILWFRYAFVCPRVTEIPRRGTSSGLLDLPVSCRLPAPVRLEGRESWADMRVAWSPEEALEALGAGRLLVRHPAVVLIVDDCPSLQVDTLAARFRAAAGPHASARLLVMTPASEQELGKAKLSPPWS